MAIGIVHGYRPPAVISSSFFFSKTKWAKPLYSNWKQPHLHTSLLDKQGKGMPQHEVRCILNTPSSLLFDDYWLLFDDWLFVAVASIVLHHLYFSSMMVVLRRRRRRCRRRCFKFFFRLTVQMKASRVWRNSSLKLCFRLFWGDEEKEDTILSKYIGNSLYFLLKDKELIHFFFCQNQPCWTCRWKK